jgi:predicted DNA-binding transcriptional regulator AlpA
MSIEAKKDAGTERLARSIPEFSLHVGVGRSTIYLEIKAGRLRRIKVGKRSIIGDDDGRAWLKARAAESAP